MIASIFFMRGGSELAIAAAGRLVEWFAGDYTNVVTT
jgi:hypothetical protein